MWETRQKHWRRYVDICKICSIEWDFIGKTEHFEQDHNYMFRKLGILGRVRLFAVLVSSVTQLEATPTKDEVGGPLTGERNVYGANNFYRYFTGLNRQTLEKLYDFYKVDFELFGYEVPSRLWEMADAVNN